MSINRDEWLAAVHEVEETPLPESDALTVQEVATLIGKHREVAQRYLSQLVAQKRAVKTTKRIRRSDNQLMTVTAYRLKD